MKNYYFKNSCMVVLLCGLGFAAACGSSTRDCSLTGLTVSPQSATADHSPAAPANSQQFAAFGVISQGCASTQSNLTNVTWSVSDPQNVSISNAHDQTYGVATCINATSGPVTVTATASTGSTTGSTVSGTASLTCE